MNRAFMKAENYLDKKTKRPKYSATGMYMTEKFDGMRAQWDPVTQILASRYGNQILAPQWFLDFFKEIQIPLDGELFFGYGNWGMTGVCRAKTQQALHDNEPVWRRAKYLVFDVPDPDSGTYLERMSVLEHSHGVSAWGSDDTPIWLIPRQLVTSTAVMETYYKAVLDRGGEGIMLNNPVSFYVSGRTDNILKYKPIMDDECVIVGYKPGKGRNTGRLGSFVVHPIEDGNPIPGREFSISGMTDLVRSSYKRTHPIGTILRYSCMEYTKTGKPRHPVYLGICRKPVTVEQEQLSIKELSELAEPKTQKLKPKLKAQLRLGADTVSKPIHKIRAKLRS